MKGFGTSIGGVLKSLGLIAVAMEIFMFLKDLLMKNQKVVDTLAIAFKAIEVLFGKLTDAIEPMGKVLMDAFENPKQALKDLWEAIKTNFLNRIKGIAVAAEGVGKVIKAAFELDWDGVKEGMIQYGQALVQVTSGLDIEQQDAFVNGIVKAGTEALSTASKIEKLRKEVKLGEAQQGLLMLQYQREAELQRQIRDNVSLTIEARQEANKKLGGILNEQSGEEMKLANKRLELALLEQSINKTSLDAEIEVVNARKGIADINERITGQRSEQLTNENSLKQEGVAISKERISQLEAEAQAEADAAFAISEAKVSAQELLDAYKSERESLSAEQVMQAEIDAALAAEELKFQAAVNAAQALGVFQTEIDELELAQIDERLRIENEIRAKYGDENIRKQEEITNALAKVEADNVKAVKDAEIAKKKLRMDGMVAAGSILGAIDQLVAASGKNSKQALVLQKTLAVAQIAIDTAKAIVGAIAQAQSVPYPGNLVAIATGVAAVIAGIASAVTTLNSADVGGATAAQPQAPQVTSAPAVQQATSGTTELGGAEQAQLAPIQAFVVETEVTGNQNNVNQIESQANFG